MGSWQRFLVNVFLRAPQEFLVALLRLLLFLLILIVVLLLKAWRFLLWLWYTKSLFEEETEENCGELPEAIIRRPDPAIYSQSYLRSQDLPVTWNNPDIWVAPASDPAAVEPDSYHLLDDTDYIVSVRVHNASTDPAIGVKVRLVYRPWSFNSPDLVPIETDTDGNEIFRFVDVAPMGSTIAQFNWHTPAVAPGEKDHFCIQAHLSHPLDINTANNIGQENTNVYSQNPGHVAPGEVAIVGIPLFNNGRGTVNARFNWDTYAINEEDKTNLELQINCGRARQPLTDRLVHILPTVRPAHTIITHVNNGDDVGIVSKRPSFLGRTDFSTPKSRFKTAKNRYTGFETYRQILTQRDYSLPTGMEITHNLNLDQLQLPPQGQQTVQVTIKIPDDAQDGLKLPLNIMAETDAGVLLGGVTILFEVQV